MLLTLLACSADSTCLDGFGEIAPNHCVRLASVGDDAPDVGDDVAVFPDTSDPGDSGDTGDTGEDVYVPTEDPVVLHAAALSDLVTAVAVQWHPGSQGGWLEVAAADQTVLVEGELQADGTYRSLILAPEGTALSIEAVNPLARSAPSLAETGELPAEVRSLVFGQRAASSVLDDHLVFTAIADGRPVVKLSTPEGEPLWYRFFDDERVDPTAGQPLLDGSGVLVGAYAGGQVHGEFLESMDDNALEVWDWDGSVRSVHPAPQAHHFLSQSRPGEALYVRAVVHEQEDRRVAFDEVVAVDLASGAQSSLYETSDVPWIEATCAMDGFYGEVCDAHHANSVSCHPDNGLCLLSLRGVEDVVAFERSTGDALASLKEWTMVPLTGASRQPFQGAHDVQWSGADRFLVYNNGDFPVVEDGLGGWASEYQVDWDTRELRELWTTRGQGPCIASTAIGFVQPLAEGHHLVHYGAPASVAYELDPAGEVLWEVALNDREPSWYCELDEMDVQGVLGEVRVLRLDDLASWVGVVLPRS